MEEAMSTDSDKSDESSSSEEPMSAYERMVEKNRMEKMAFLQSLKIEEVKAELIDDLKMRSSRKEKKQIKKYLEKEKTTTPPVLRKSRRLAMDRIDISKVLLKKPRRKKKTTTGPVLRKSRRLAMEEIDIFEDFIEEKPQEVIPPEMTFKEALLSEDFYESYKVDVKIQESKPGAKFTVYDKSVLDNMTISESNIAKVTAAGITALTWYPSPEQMIVAAGDLHGQLGIWNVESGNPYLFVIHLGLISNLQFCPFNRTQLMSSSHDGTLRCGDIVQHNFSEIYNVSDETFCTYFDVLSASTYLVAQKNGQVALVDKRTEGKGCEKKQKCHEDFIRTVNIHPTNKNVFVTAENKGSIRLWDLRNLQSTPVADITHHKHCVHSAFFSPLAGNSILAQSSDDSISMFDSTQLTSDIKLRVQMKYKSDQNKGFFKPHFLRATWLPNTEEIFVVGSFLKPCRIEVFDKNLFKYSTMMDKNLTLISYLNAFHPTRPALAGGNAGGKVVVFI